MPENSKDIEGTLIALPHRERAKLAAVLLASLDDGVDEDVSDLWLEEAQRRLEAFDAGETSARDADEVLSDIRARFK
jgi:putative addiction module component (TIGR02574 family)